MRDIPIIFSAPMVRALLDGRKTQTRRILKPQPKTFAVDNKGTMCDVGLQHLEGDPLPRIWLGKDGAGVLTEQKVRYAVGDRLWVRENIWQNGTWVRTEDETGEIGSKWVSTSSVRMMADETKPAGSGNFVWRSIPSIHMPRWASRLTLVVEQVRVERLQDITREDVYAEGAITDEWLQWREDAGNIGMPEGSSIEDERDVFDRLWTSLHGDGSWDANPWVVALTFRVIRSNIDAIQSQEAA